jgi:hypothetical protein
MNLVGISGFEVEGGHYFLPLPSSPQANIDAKEAQEFERGMVR